MFRPRLFTLLAASLVALASCGSGTSGQGGGQATDLGKPCSLAAPTSPSVLTLDATSATCESHLCLSPPGLGVGPQTSLCSATCSSDDDCANGIKSTGTEPDGVPRCRLGFRCRTLIPPLEGNPASCKPLCVCIDSFLDPNQVATKPPGC